MMPESDLREQAARLEGPLPKLMRRGFAPRCGRWSPRWRRAPEHQPIDQTILLSMSGWRSELRLNAPYVGEAAPIASARSQRCAPRGEFIERQNDASEEIVASLGRVRWFILM